MQRVVMLLATVALAYYSLPQAEAYGGSCPAFFALIGPCVGFMCPMNGTCICDCCCLQVVSLGAMAALPAPMAGRRGVRGRRRGVARTEAESASDCQDKLPDCLTKRRLCNNPQFNDFMTENCPASCNRCPQPSKLSDREEKEKGVAPEEEDADRSTSIAQFYGNNRGGYGSYGDYGGNYANYGNRYRGGNGYGFGSNYGNYYG